MLHGSPKIINKSDIISKAHTTFGSLLGSTINQLDSNLVYLLVELLEKSKRAVSEIPFVLQKYAESGSNR